MPGTVLLDEPFSQLPRGCRCQHRWVALVADMSQNEHPTREEVPFLLSFLTGLVLQGEKEMVRFLGVLMTCVTLIGCSDGQRTDTTQGKDTGTKPPATAPDKDAREKLLERLREEARRQLAENEPFGFSFALPDTKGDVISLDDFKGKVVIVDIWGTWCLPCRKEVPHFIALRHEYSDEGLEVVGINYERGPESEWIGKIESFVAENGITYPCVIGDDMTRDMVPEFSGYPTTLFIDRTGVVRLKGVG